MIDQAFLQLSERENRELCAELLKKGSHFWESYASKPGNLDFFDGIMHMLSLPKETLDQSLSYILNLLNNINKKNAKNITNSLMSIKDASYWKEIEITAKEESYLEGLYYILGGILLNKNELRIDGAKIIFELLDKKDQLIDISAIKKLVKDYITLGHEAPDVD